MRKHRSLLPASISLLAIAGLSLLGSAGLMASAINYRSPLHSNPPAPGQQLGSPLTQKVVIVLVDALRLDTSLKTNLMPVLNELRTQGANASMHSCPPSFSEPGYATLLTGAWPEINDSPILNMDFGDNSTFTQDDLFSAAHRIGLKTAISGYYWFEELVPQSAVDSHFYTHGEDARADAEVMQAALPLLEADYPLILIHLDQLDYAGHHLGGPLDPAWDLAAKKVDSYLSAIASQLDFATNTLIVLSDHGQIDPGGHGGGEPVTLLEPFVMLGAGIRPGEYAAIQQVDVAPTVAALLGLNIPASTQGTTLINMLNVSSEYAARIESFEATQKANLYQAYTAAIHIRPQEISSLNTPTTFTQAMETARARKLAGERLWRTPIAVLLGLLPAAVLIYRKVKKTFWLVIGALIYSLLFNFAYAIFEGRTYSLSSVESETGFLVSLAVTSGIALVVTWLVIMARMDGFKKSPRRAVRTSLGLLMMILYFLLLPVLVNFAVNGLTVAWTLPEFYTIFIALLSFIQIIFVVVFGLLLTGAIFFITRLVPHSKFSAV